MLYLFLIEISQGQFNLYKCVGFFQSVPHNMDHVKVVAHV